MGWNLVGEATIETIQVNTASDQPEYIFAALAAGFPSSTTEEESLRKIYSFRIVSPITLLCILVVCVLVVSVIVDITNRQSFINKKIIDALTKQREKILLKQKEDHENLIHSIFPPAVAKDLIQQQMHDSLSKVNSEMACKSFGHKNLGHMSLGRSVAQMHQEVTILFTDIVGFTSMSQTVAPQQVMQFLHELFVRFD